MRSLLARSVSALARPPAVFWGMLFLLSASVHGMGLRAFVALPVDANGGELRLAYTGAEDYGNGVLSAGLALGLAPRHALLFGLPYRFSSSQPDAVAPVSLLYRYTQWVKDSPHGTRRLAWLAGYSVPLSADQHGAVQAGLVYTRFYRRHELDADFLYQYGQASRPDSARIDISWQYRLSPRQHPQWGLAPQLNTVLELNGQWIRSQAVNRQLTAGLQWVWPRWVVEGGYGFGLARSDADAWVVSVRYHF